MSRGKMLGQIVFGQNFSERIADLYSKEDPTQEEALEVLAAIQHSEMREVLDDLKSQMNQGLPIAEYSLFTHFDRQILYFEKERSDPDKVLLFTDQAYRNGLMHVFYKLLEKAFPDYKAPRWLPLGEIRMKKK